MSSGGARPRTWQVRDRAGFQAASFTIHFTIRFRGARYVDLQEADAKSEMRIARHPKATLRGDFLFLVIARRPGIVKGTASPEHWVEYFRFLGRAVKNGPCDAGVNAGV